MNEQSTRRYADLIGIPHADINCYELACVAAERFGRRVPDVGSQTVRESLSADGAIDALDFATEEHYRVSESDALPGDLVMMRRRPDSVGIEHLGVIVEPGRVLHSLENQHSRVDRIAVLRRVVHSIWRLPKC